LTEGARTDVHACAGAGCFTTDDYLARARRVVEVASEKGLAGVLVTPGPDLVWLTGSRPTAITERLTVLVLSPDQEPTLLVPTLERPVAAAAEGARGGWRSATGPTPPTRTRRPARCSGPGQLDHDIGWHAQPGKVAAQREREPQRIALSATVSPARHDAGHGERSGVRRFVARTLGSGQECRGTHILEGTFGCQCCAGELGEPCRPAGMTAEQSTGVVDDVTFRRQAPEGPTAPS
jgi:Creatinase/Prolidase N-terminal domain